MNIQRNQDDTTMDPVSDGIEAFLHEQGSWSDLPPELSRLARGEITTEEARRRRVLSDASPETIDFELELFQPLPPSQSDRMMDAALDAVAPPADGLWPRILVACQGIWSDIQDALARSPGLRIGSVSAVAASLLVMVFVFRDTSVDLSGETATVRFKMNDPVHLGTESYRYTVGNEALIELKLSTKLDGDYVVHRRVTHKDEYPSVHGCELHDITEHADISPSFVSIKGPVEEVLAHRGEWQIAYTIGAPGACGCEGKGSSKCIVTDAQPIVVE